MDEFGGMRNGRGWYEIDMGGERRCMRAYGPIHSIMSKFPKGT